MSKGSMLDMMTPVFSLFCVSHNSSGHAVFSLLTVLKTITMFFPFSRGFFLLGNFPGSASIFMQKRISLISNFLRIPLGSFHRRNPMFGAYEKINPNNSQAYIMLCEKLKTGHLYTWLCHCSAMDQIK